MATEYKERSSGITPELMTALEAIRVFLDEIGESNKTQAEIKIHIQNLNTRIDEIRISQMGLSAYFTETKGLADAMHKRDDYIIDHIKEQNTRMITILSGIVAILTTIFGFIVWLTSRTPIN